MRAVVRWITGWRQARITARTIHVMVVVGNVVAVMPIGMTIDEVKKMMARVLMMVVVEVHVRSTIGVAVLTVEWFWIHHLSRAAKIWPVMIFIPSPK